MSKENTLTRDGKRKTTNGNTHARARHIPEREQIFGKQIYNTIDSGNGLQ